MSHSFRPAITLIPLHITRTSHDRQVALSQTDSSTSCTPPKGDDALDESLDELRERWVTHWLGDSRSFGIGISPADGQPTAVVLDSHCAEHLNAEEVLNRG
jgi:hypothetical protein